MASPIRPLSGRERGIVERLLDQLGTDGASFHAQLESASVRGACTCGCPSFEFMRDGGGVAEPKRILADAYVASPAGRGLGIILWARGRELQEVEVHGFIGPGPHQLPEVESVWLWGLGPGPS